MFRCVLFQPHNDKCLLHVTAEPGDRGVRDEVASVQGINGFSNA